MEKIDNNSYIINGFKVLILGIIVYTNGEYKGTYLSSMYTI